MMQLDHSWVLPWRHDRHWAPKRAADKLGVLLPNFISARHWTSDLPFW